ncbi:MAG: hypothetical protein AAF570_00790 [Bacteroidota bacterium]
MNITDEDFTGKSVDGKREGRWTSYYDEAGRAADTDPNVYHYGLKKEAYYRNGLLHGLYAEYYKKGFKAYCHFKEGKLHGAAGWYYPGNNLKYKGQFENGHKSGAWEAYNRAGKLMFVDGYEAGKLVSNVTHEAFEKLKTPNFKLE